jgi:serine/threonine protein kinase
LRNDTPFATDIVPSPALAQQEILADWYRTTRPNAGQAVLLYVPRQGDRAALERQRALIAPVAAASIDRAIDLVELNGKPALVIAEDGHPGFLTDLAGQKLTDLDRFFAIAIGLAEALAALHAREILHRDIRPANIRWAPETGSIRLAAFSLAAELHRAGAVDPSGPLQGDLPYIAPEQT